jgi:hypothetical protein
VNIEGLNDFETKQFHLLSSLMKLQPSLVTYEPEPANVYSLQSCSYSDRTANKTERPSFRNISHDNAQGFSNSYDPNATNINTSFVDGDRPVGYMFNAGGSSSDDHFVPPKPRSKSSSRLGRNSPTKHRVLKKTQSSEAARAAADQTGGASSAFDAGGWSEKIGSHDFEPRPAQGSSASPTRRQTRKKSIRKTMGTAAVVNEELSSSDELPRTRSRGEEANGDFGIRTASPNAMDIDDEPPASAPSEINGARNIPVEPSRPEWRSGNVVDLDGQNKPRSAPTATFTVPAAGSEDSEDVLRANLSDIRNVEPFAPGAPGLASFGDLKSTLPFESKASARAPLHRERTKHFKQLSLPHPPKAPHAPAPFAIPTLKPSPSAWAAYEQEFRHYMQDYAAFSAQFADHFTYRKRQIDKEAKEGFRMLDNDGIDEYASWLQQDSEVRKQWVVACEEHALRVKEFMTFRDKMKS